MTALKARARGRWAEILSSLSVDESVLDGKHHACPGCGGVDRFRYIRDEEGGYFCGDERSDGIGLVQHILGVNFREAAELIEKVVGKGQWCGKPPAQTYADRLQRLASSSTRSKYLESRGLEVAPGLRFARSVDYHDADAVRKYAAMLAPVTRDGKFLTYHATYLLDGEKAPEKPYRKLLPGPKTNGASVALYPPAEVMGVGEGIETCIAAKMLFRVPVWAALSTSLMKSWEPPAVARVVKIFADHDVNAAGQAAAWHLCHRLRMKGLEVDVVMPAILGDWNDVLRTRLEDA